MPSGRQRLPATLDDIWERGRMLVTICYKIAPFAANADGVMEGPPLREEACGGGITTSTHALRFPPYEYHHLLGVGHAITTRRLPPLTIIPLQCIYRGVHDHGHGGRQAYNTCTTMSSVMIKCSKRSPSQQYRQYLHNRARILQWGCSICLALRCRKDDGRSSPYRRLN